MPRSITGGGGGRRHHRTSGETSSLRSGGAGDSGDRRRAASAAPTHRNRHRMAPQPLAAGRGGANCVGHPHHTAAASRQQQQQPLTYHNRTPTYAHQREGGFGATGRRPPKRDSKGSSGSMTAVRPQHDYDDVVEEEGRHLRRSSLVSLTTADAALKVARAFGARTLFAVHSVLTIWQATEVRDNPYYWAFALIPVAMLFEGVYMILTRDGDERKWFCPSVLLYIIATVPPIWAIEMNIADTRYQRSQNSTQSVNAFSQLHTLDLGPDDHLRPSHELWVQVSEQLLLVLLIVGRWILPKGLITREQLSQILLAYLAIASDIVQLFDLFQQDAVTANKHLQYIVLSIWSLSLLQFPFVLTGSGARWTRIVTTKPSNSEDLKRLEYRAAHNLRQRSTLAQVVRDLDIWAILIANCLQDVPFLLCRVHLMLAYRVVNCTMFFFTCKNVLIILLQSYRAFVLVYDRYYRPAERDDTKLLMQHYRQMLVTSTEGLARLRMRHRSLFGDEENDQLAATTAAYMPHHRHSYAGDEREAAAITTVAAMPLSTSSYMASALDEGATASTKPEATPKRRRKQRKEDAVSPTPKPTVSPPPQGNTGGRRKTRKTTPPPVLTALRMEDDDDAEDNLDEHDCLLVPPTPPAATAAVPRTTGGGRKLAYHGGGSGTPRRGADEGDESVAGASNRVERRPARRPPAEEATPSTGVVAKHETHEPRGREKVPTKRKAKRVKDTGDPDCSSPSPRIKPTGSFDSLSLTLAMGGGGSQGSMTNVYDATDSPTPPRRLRPPTDKEYQATYPPSPLGYMPRGATAAASSTHGDAPTKPRRPASSSQQHAQVRRHKSPILEEEDDDEEEDYEDEDMEDEELPERRTKFRRRRDE